MGKRALKFRDFGKVAATFCDLKDDRAVRVVALETSKARAKALYPEIGDKNQIKVTDEEVQRAMVERARQFPGQEQQVWEYYRNNPQAVASLRAPIYEEKVVDFLIELVNVTEKKVTREDLYKEDDEDKPAEKATG